MRKIAIISIPILLFCTDAKELYTKHGCYGCHGVNGGGVAKYPKLINLEKSYIINRLNLYKNDKIQTDTSSIMSPFAKALNEKEIEALASYLSKLKDDKNREKFRLEFETWDGGGS